MYDVHRIWDFFFIPLPSVCKVYTVIRKFGAFFDPPPSLRTSYYGSPQRKVPTQSDKERAVKRRNREGERGDAVKCQA